MNYCYIRVSTDKQVYDRQLSVLKLNGYSRENSIYLEETYTGKKKSRPVFDKMIEEMQKGDTLVVESLTRLGRSLPNNNEIMDLLLYKRGINIRVLKENFTFIAGERMDAVTKLMLNMFNSLAEFERDQLSERTIEGLRARKEAGTRLGRPVSKDSQKKKEDMYMMFQNGMSISSIAREFGCSKQYVSNVIKSLD